MDENGLGPMNLREACVTLARLTSSSSTTSGSRTCSRRFRLAEQHRKEGTPDAT